jgi:hypothetical protein
MPGLFPRAPGVIPGQPPGSMVNQHPGGSIPGGFFAQQVNPQPARGGTFSQQQAIAPQAGHVHVGGLSEPSGVNGARSHEGHAAHWAEFDQQSAHHASNQSVHVQQGGEYSHVVVKREQRYADGAGSDAFGGDAHARAHNDFHVQQQQQHDVHAKRRDSARAKDYSRGNLPGNSHVRIGL